MPWRKEWRGQLLLKSEGTYQFHAFMHGKVRVQVGQQVLLDGASDKPAWISGPATALSFGEQPFIAMFTHAANKGYGLKLYWSSDSFPLEPLPHHVLFHTEDSSRLHLAKVGAAQIQAANCYSCHKRDWWQSTLSQHSLDHIGVGTSWAAIRQRLVRRDADPNHGRMPAFGFSEADADAIIAYLVRHSKSLKLAEPPKIKINAKETPTGRELIKSVGCLACHEWQSFGQSPVFGGGKLDDVGLRRSRAWLDLWLRDPSAINGGHRMPVFKLTDAERQQIVVALIGDQQFPKENDVPKVTEELVTQGRRLIASARCAFCHSIEGDARDRTYALERRATEPGPMSPERILARAGCLSAEPDPKKFRPAFHYVDPQALAAAVMPETEIVRLSDLEKTGCTNCHDRDGGRGLSNITLALLKSEPQWQGQTPTLVPPPLTAIGDKLQDAALEKAMRGEQTPRMPWLKVRMPKFRDVQVNWVLKEELIDHDRIPPNAPATLTYPTRAADETADPQTLIAGRELTGGKGFSCVACHALKDYVPKQVALGTRGSDLYRLGDRLRPEFFFRWTRSPLRIIPGVEMPGYTRPHPTLLDGQLDRQLAAMWDALHDPNFTAPTNPAVVEQLWTLQPGDRPRIIRDVFTIPKLSAPPAKGGTGGVEPDAAPKTGRPPPNPPLAGGANEVETVPRAFAVGFPNGHSVLFDLDRGAVRAWTIGDFARQRTQGKSWFWDLAGVTVAGGMGNGPDIVLNLINPRTGRPAERCSLQQAKLTSYYVSDNRVRLSYVQTWNVRFDELSTDFQSEVPVVEEWSPLEGGSGWQRTVLIVANSQASVMRPNAASSFGAPTFSVLKQHIDSAGQPLRQFKNAQSDFRPFTAESITAGNDAEFPIQGGGINRFAIRVRYNSSLQRPDLALPIVAPIPIVAEAVTNMPGFRGTRLPLPHSIMPTAITWDSKQRLAFTSLKGDVYIAKDSDGDGLEDQLSTFAEGLAAPFGILAKDEETQGRQSLGFLVAHKPEVLALRDRDGDDVADGARIIVSGWGYTDDYHDWTTGIARDSQGWHYIGLGSDYAHKNRPANESKWRGRILRFDLKGNVESVASELRYPVGLTVTEDDQLFCSDQQGVQNCFNELNYIQLGHRYGVPAKNDPRTEAPADVAAVQIPHPWTRSINGVAYWPKWTGHPFAGQIVGAEFNHRALVRFSLQEVDGQMQGAVYPLSKFSESTGPENLLGPIAVAFSRTGDLYVGSLYDSGWLGGLNVGDIVRLTPNVNALPNGIREIRAIAGGFAIEFLKPVDRAKAEQAASYKISGYTRVWGGEYATPDSGQHTATVQGAKLSADGRTVELVVNGLKAGHVYDVSVSELDAALWPSLAHYTLTRIPR